MSKKSYQDIYHLDDAMYDKYVRAGMTTEEFEKWFFADGDYLEVYFLGERLGIFRENPDHTSIVFADDYEGDLGVCKVIHLFIDAFRDEEQMHDDDPKIARKVRENREIGVYDNKYKNLYTF